MTPMTLTERYLKAVAAQLPKATRDDIVAELKDAIQNRMEDREETLGRPLTEADEEAVLREFGHPLAVAGRYGSGPQHLVGPELYPWWMFAVKVGLAALVCITVIGAIVRVIVGDVYAGQAIGQAFHSLFSSAVTLIGLATIAGFIIERQKIKPAFMREWRVKDLGLFELGGLDPDTVSRHVSGMGGARAERGRRHQLSPTARALASAAAWVVLLLWWIGLVPVAHLSPEDFGAVVNGVDYATIISQIAATLYWPVVVYAAARIAFDLMRAARPEALRLAAVGDTVFGLAQAALFAWLWTASPLAPLIHVDTVQAFVDRIRDGLGGQVWSLSMILMACVAFGFVQSVIRVLGAAWRLVTGRERDFGMGHRRVAA